MNELIYTYKVPVSVALKWTIPVCSLEDELVNVAFEQEDFPHDIYEKAADYSWSTEVVCEHETQMFIVNIWITPFALQAQD